MKAYLIDPFAQTVTEVEYSGDYKHIYAMIEADTFDCARFNQHGDAVFVDDEGLINGKEQRFFTVKGYGSPLAGKGFVLGCDMNTGDSKDPAVSLEQMRELVTFVFPLKVAGGSLAFLPIGKHRESA
jgi:hypothetical protein